MAKASNLLPNTIEQAVKGTPVAMLLHVVDQQNIEAFLAIELTKLASLINVDERLNLQGHQIPFIASQLIEIYKNETLADFKICFERGAMGRYDDKLLRLDAAVINNWMHKYLEEKYVVVEKNLSKQKEVEPTKAEHQAFLKELLERTSKETGIDTLPKNNAQENAYERYKLERDNDPKVILQKKINDTASEFYQAKGGYKNIQTWTADNGFYVFAENENDARIIYENATQS